MGSRDKYIRRDFDLDLTPKERDLFYFPCGSISSCQESLEFTEEEKDQDSVIFLKPNENDDKAYNPQNSPNYITYEQFSYEKPSFEELEILDEFTVGPLKPPKKRVEIKDAIVNTDLKSSSIDDLQIEISSLSAQLHQAQDEILQRQAQYYDLQKALKLIKSDLTNTKDKVKQQEIEISRLKQQDSEYFKVKMLIEDLLDEDGTNKTARSSPSQYSSFETLKSKLNCIKKKIKSQSFIKTPVKALQDSPRIDYSLQYKSRDPIASSFNSKISEIKISPAGKEMDEELHTERPKSTILFDYENSERITYKEVLRDLKEITTRASKALKNSSLNRRSSNFSSGSAFRHQDGFKGLGVKDRFEEGKKKGVRNIKD